MPTEASKRDRPCQGLRRYHGSGRCGHRAVPAAEPSANLGLLVGPFTLPLLAMLDAVYVDSKGERRRGHQTQGAVQARVLGGRLSISSFFGFLPRRRSCSKIEAS